MRPLFRFDDPHNRLTITGAQTSGVTLDPVTFQSDLILLATVSFTNGTWFANSPPTDPGLGEIYGESRFDFSLLAYPDPFIGSSLFPTYHVWNDTLVLTSTRGPANPPDLLTFAFSPFLGSVAVDENTTGSFEIWGRIGSLYPVELRNPSPGVQFVSAVPLPAAWAGMVGALVLLGRRRR